MDRAPFLNTWIEISESAYAHNLKFFKQTLSPTTELSVVVKSNAYGHGMAEIARLAVQYGADSFCVHSLEEAVTLREAGYRQNILVMGHIPLKMLEEAIRYDLRIVLYNLESLRELQRAAARRQQPARVHLKLETGTHRQGISAEELPVFLEELAANPGVQLEGAYTHFANIEDTTNHEYAFRQLEHFKQLTTLIRSHGFSSFIRHTACSAAILLFPETYFEMVRLGISQYGLWPSRETMVSYKMSHPNDHEKVLQPVLTWKTRISQIKRVKANQCIGYGCTYQTTRDSRIAILPVGYSDGYDRGLSNQGYVLIHGKRAQVRGRVCMNITMVDITDIPEARLEDEAVLIGRQGEEEVSADFLANLLGTINYEVVTRINWQIPRVIVK